MKQLLDTKAKIDPSTSYEGLHRASVVLDDQLQNSVTMNFAKVPANAALPNSLFTFTPPAGAAVVPLDVH